MILINIAIEFFAILLSCIMETFITYDFMSKLYSKKCDDKHYTIYRILTVIVWGIISWLQIPLLNASFVIILPMVLSFSIFESNNKLFIIQNLLFSTIFIFCDAIISSLTSMLLHKAIIVEDANPKILFLNVIIIQSLFLAIYRVFIAAYRRTDEPIRWNKYLWLTLVPILNMILVPFIIALSKISQYNDLAILILSMFLVIIDIFVGLLINYIIRIDSLENKIKLEELQKTMQLNYFRQIEVKYDKAKSLIHDINRHMQTIEGLYKKNENDIGFRYALKLLKAFKEITETFKCSNRILSIIINDKIRACNISNIKFVYKIEDINLDFIEDIDITTLFANLLDNAIQAANLVDDEDKYVELRLYKFNGMIAIEVINATICQLNADIIDGNIITLGIGLNNIINIIKKYKGSINIKCENHKFYISALF